MFALLVCLWVIERDRLSGRGLGVLIWVVCPQCSKDFISGRTTTWIILGSAQGMFWFLQPRSSLDIPGQVRLQLTFIFGSFAFNYSFFSIADKWYRDRKYVIDRCKDIDRKVQRQVKNGGSERRAGYPAERSWSFWQHPFRECLWERRWVRRCLEVPSVSDPVLRVLGRFDMLEWNTFLQARHLHYLRIANVYACMYHTHGVNLFFSSFNEK